MSKKKIGIVIVLSVLFILLTLLVVFNCTNGFDMAFYNFLMNFRCDFLDNYFIFITKFGDVSFIIGMIVGFILLVRNIVGLLFGCLAIDCVIVNKIVKHLIQRERPSVLKLIKQGGFSYPSGHSMISVCMYGYLIYLVNKYFTNKKVKFLCSFLLVFLILSIGISRVYVGVHFISDVIGGYLLSLILLILYIELSEKILSRGK